MEEFIRERDAIVEEIGGFSEDDFTKSGISMEEYNNPNADTIIKILDYVKREYDQTAVYGGEE